MRNLTLISFLALAACGNETPTDAVQDDLAEMRDDHVDDMYPADAQVDAQTKDMVAKLVPENSEMVGEPIRARLGDDSSEAVYFMSQDGSGRLMMHRTRDNETVETERMAADRVASVKGMKIEQNEGTNEIVVTYVGIDDDGGEFDQMSGMSSDAERMKRMERPRTGPARTWMSQNLDEVLAMSITCAARHHDDLADADIDSDPTRYITGAVLTPGPGAAWTIDLPATDGDHAAPMATVRVDPAAGTCNGAASHHQITTVTNRFTARGVMKDAHDCAAQTTDGSLYASSTPTLKYDEENQWLAMFTDGDPLTVKLEYDGTEMSECTKMDG